MDWDKVVETYKRLNQEMLFLEAKRTKAIDDAVLIMNPVHKKEMVALIESGLHPLVLWHPACEEDKIYMITDEKFKEEIRNNYWRHEGVNNEH